MKRNIHLPRNFQLDYLSEYPLEGVPGRRRRNVRLLSGSPPNYEARLGQFNFNSFGYQQASRLEGRENVDDNEGVWPIDAFRCDRRLGDPGQDFFPLRANLTTASPRIYEAAREMRQLGYHRVVHSSLAEHLVDGETDVRLATLVTPEWYDPPGGQIAVNPHKLDIRGSHAVPLMGILNFGPKGKYFWFRNSWGGDWGHRGEGGLSFDYFDRFMIEAWHGFGAGLFMPLEIKQGTTCLEWKWSKSDSVAVHGREIVDAGTSDRLAWAFCVRRDGYLDVEEFYVWPTERGKGYGRKLAEMVRSLAAQMTLPIRLLVSYADTEPENLDRAKIAAQLLGVELAESSERWIHMVGTASPVFVRRPYSRPCRPAMFVEWLRPSDERPHDSPIEYQVFFGTNRRPAETTAGTLEFGPSRDSTLHLGMSRVQIPRSHRFGSRGNLWRRVWNRWLGERPDIGNQQVFPGEGEFGASYAKLAAVFSGEPDVTPQNLLFIHGYNVSFTTAIVTAAQLGVDLKVPGATFAYCWPSPPLKCFCPFGLSPDIPATCLRPVADRPGQPLNVVTTSETVQCAEWLCTSGGGIKAQPANANTG